MEKGTLYGVSVGPGDPDLMTLRAVEVLRRSDCIAAPDVGGTSRTALGVVERHIAGKDVLDCPTPMTRDRASTARAYDRIADRIAAVLDAGRSVAFVTLGDASIYSTWSYVCERMRGRGYDIEVVPGVPSFCAAAAELREPLCERSEQLLVVPVSAEGLPEALDVPGTKVFMKSGKRLPALRAALRERGLESGAALVSNCGLPGQVVVRNLEEADDGMGYLSVVIVKDPGDGRPSGGKAEGNMEGEWGGSVRERAVGLGGQGAHPALADLAERIALPDEDARAAAQARWNAVAKPVGGLGVLEDDVVRMAALVGTPDVSLGKRAVVVMCADNGVVAQGVSQCGPEVTRTVAENIARGTSSVCLMARTAQVDAFAVDMGMMKPARVEGVWDLAVSQGTGDISYGPAMTADQALRAVRSGVQVVGELAGRGYGIIASGEMGIGNTTTASAIAAVLLGMPADQVVGRGAGLSDAGMRRKRAAVERALAVNAPDPADALDVLAKVGGFDIAGLAGLFIGGAVHRVPVVVDGFISSVAAALAVRLVPGCACALLASHVSSEPAAVRLLDDLGLRPAIQAGMHLGEGTGAVCLVPLLDAALALYGGTTFDDAGIEPYDAALRARMA